MTCVQLIIPHVIQRFHCLLVILSGEKPHDVESVERCFIFWSMCDNCNFLIFCLVCRGNYHAQWSLWCKKCSSLWLAELIVEYNNATDATTQKGVTEGDKRSKGFIYHMLCCILYNTLCKSVINHGWRNEQPSPTEKQDSVEEGGSVCVHLFERRV